MELFDRRGVPIRHAEDIRFANATSGLAATDVQAAIDEIVLELPELIEDTVAFLIDDTTSVHWTYDDATPSFTANVQFANPTSPGVNLVGSNGTAQTAMRSDAVLVLDQGIIPTWTALHTFNTTPVVPNDSWTYAKLQNATALSLLGRASNVSGDLADIVAASDGDILRRSGTSIGFGTILSTSVSDFTEAAQDAVGGILADTSEIDFTYDDAGASISATLRNASIAYVRLQTATGLSLLGRSTNSTGVLADIVAASDGDILRRSGTAIGFGTILATSVSDFTEAAQDAVGAALTDTSEIDFTYSDAGNTISAALIDTSIVYARLQNAAALSLLGRAANSIGVLADITAGSDGDILRRSGTSIGFGTVLSTSVSDFTEAAQDAVGGILTDTAEINFTYSDAGNQITADLINSSIHYARLQDAAALSILGRSANSGGVLADIVAASDGDVLRRSGTAVGFGAIVLAASNFANPSSPGVDLTGANGTALTGMRSDAKLVLDQSIAPTWTSTHTWTDSDKVQLGTGADLQLYHDGTDSFISSGTGRLFIPAVDTTGSFYLGGSSYPAILSAAALAVLNIRTVVSDYGASGINSAAVLARNGEANTVWMRVNGTLAAPTAILINQVLGSQYSVAYHTATSDFVAASPLRVITSENWALGAQGNYLQFIWTQTGTTANAQLQMRDLSVRGPDGTLAAPAWSFVADTNTGRYRIGADNMADVTGGVALIEYATNYVDTKVRPRRTGVSSPSALASGNNNNYAIAANIATARLTPNAAGSTVTGITNGTASDQLRLWNISTTVAITLLHDDGATSTAANRFLLASGTNTTIQPGGCADLEYDGTSSRWRQINRVA